MAPVTMRWMCLTMVSCVWAAGAVAARAAEGKVELTRPGGASGVMQYMSGTWGVVGATVENGRSRELEATVATQFTSDTALQFGRAMRVPANSRMTAWYPLRLPSSVEEQAKSIQTQTLLIERSGEREVAIPSSMGLVHHEGVLRVESLRPVTAVIANSQDDDALDAVVAGRLAAGLIKRMAYVGDEPPWIAQAWESVDQVVLCDDEPGMNAAQAHALRRWLVGGGKLWVMLDQVDMGWARQWLGDVLGVEVVDEVGLTEVAVAGPRGSEEPREFEVPVRLLRVTTKGMTVTHRVNGWPAAMHRSVGRGTLLVTTLGPRGWTRPRSDSDPPEKDPLRNSEVLAGAALAEITAPFLQFTSEPLLRDESMQGYVSGQIGYRIVTRGAVAAALAMFCGVIVVAGLVLARRGRLEWMGLASPVVAAAAAAAVVGMGSAARQRVPATVASLQMACSDPDCPDVAVGGLLGMYERREGPSEIGGERGGVFWPVSAGAVADSPRMLWRDMESWGWERMTLRTGAVTMMRAAGGVTLAQPIAARGTFAESGFVGRLEPGPLTRLGDAVIAAPGGRCMTVRLGGEGSFEAGADDVLPAGQVLWGSGILSDEQGRRRRVLEELLRRPIAARGTGFPGSPTMLVWAQGMDQGFAFASESQRMGAALVMAPLRIERPAAGSLVRVPAPFVRFRPAALGRGPKGLPIFDERTGTWIGPLSDAAQVLLRFEAPAELAPLRLRSATLTVDIRAPRRKLRLLGLGEAGIVEVGGADEPLGEVRAVIRDAALLRGIEGGLVAGFEVGPASGTDAEAALTGWQVHDVSMEFEGIVPEDHAHERP